MNAAEVHAKNGSGKWKAQKFPDKLRKIRKFTPKMVKTGK